MRTQRTFLLLAAGMLISCKSTLTTHEALDETWKKEKAIVDSCMGHWEYLELVKPIRIVLINASLKAHHRMPHPNFFIGSTETHDTIGMVEFDFHGQADIGDTILFSSLRNVKKALIHSDRPFDHVLKTVAENREENEILCSVKKVYYAEIESD